MTGTAALRAAVTAEAVLGHLQAFQKIADVHGGTRSSGTPGYDASADYVAEQLRNAGYQVAFETFSIPFFEELEPPQLNLRDGEGLGLRDLVPRTIVHSGSGTVEALLWSFGRDQPSDHDSGQGCEDTGFEAMPRGAVVLIRRGGCSVQSKVEHAAAAGAGAVIVYDRAATASGLPFLGELDEPASIPAVTLPRQEGIRLAQAAGRGRVEVTLRVQARSSLRPTRNLLAEHGAAGRVVLVGAHLDSVPEGPGINDNGSGAAAVLEIALQIARLRIQTPQRLRFAFWAAEEQGLLGSRHHAATRPPDQIAAVLNFDMLGSSNYARFVYDGDGTSSEEPGPPGSARIEQLFRAYFAAVRLPVTEIALEDGSDHLSFIEHGIAAGGLVAGDGEVKSSAEAVRFGGSAGAPYDPCYHAACDRLSAVNPVALAELADAAAHAVLVLGTEPHAGDQERPRRNSRPHDH